MRKKTSLATTKCFLLASLLCGCGSTTSDSLATPPTLSVDAGEVSPRLLEPSASDDRLLVDDEPATVDLLANDTLEQGRVRPFDHTGAAGGKVSISADGLLSYVPPAGNAPFLETFTYTIENSAGSSQARITAQRLRTVYVRNNVPNGNGSKGSPFSTLKSALDAIGTSPAQVFILPGDNNQPIGLEVPNVTLWPGQHIQGTDANQLPLLACHFQPSTADCSLVNLRINGSGTDPLISVVGAGTEVGTGPKVVLNNLVLANHEGDGVYLDRASAIDLTKITALNLNRSQGTAALVVRNPLGLVKASNWTVTTNPRGALAVLNGAPIGRVVQVAMNGITLKDVNNPAQLQSNGGNLQFFLLKVACLSDDLRGTLMKADIQGDAQVDAYLNDLNLKTIGEKTVALDWTYRGDSRGTLRMGSTSCDSHLADSQPRNNPLRFATRDRAQAAYCTSYTRLNPANPVTLDAYDTSILRTRVQKYTYEGHDAGLRPIRHPLYFSAHDHAQIFSRLRNNLYLSSFLTYIYYDFIFNCEVDAGQRIENFPSYTYSVTFNESGLVPVPAPTRVEDADNPNCSFIWTGWKLTDHILPPQTYIPHTWDDSFYVLRDGSKTYSGAALDSLEIPRFEGFKVP